MHIKILDKKGDFQGYIKGISIFYNRVDTTPYTNEAKTYNNKEDAINDISIIDRLINEKLNCKIE